MLNVHVQAAGADQILDREAMSKALMAQECCKEPQHVDPFPGLSRTTGP